MKILIVDDDEPARDLLRRIFQKEGLVVLDACDGMEALDVLRREPVAVILTDVLMPRLDGYRLCQAVRRDERLKDVPVIFYTANYDSSADEKMAFDVGGDAFLRKPVSGQTLLETLRRVTSLPRAAQPRPAGAMPDPQVLQEYSDRLVSKLEDRNAELGLLNTSLKASEAHYRLLADHTEDFVFLHDTGGSRLYISPSYLRVTGWTFEEIQSTDWRARLHPDDLPLVEKTRADTLAGRSTSVEHRIRCKDGRWLWLETRCKLIAGQDGGVPQVLLTSRDITARKQAEAELLRSRGQVEAIVHSVDGIVWEAELPTFQFTFVSQQAERILGYPVRRWLEEPDFWKDHLHPEDRDAALEFCVTCTQKMESHEFEYRMIAADGREVWLKDFTTVMVAEGRPAQLRGIMVDITARKRAEQRQAAFASLGQRLNAAADVETAGRIIVDIADELFGWDACSLDLYDAATDLCHPVLTMDLVNGQRAEVPAAYTDKAPSPRMRRIMEAGAELILREEVAGMMPGLIPFGDDNRPSASLMFVPLRDDQKVIGALSIQSYRLKAYGQAELQALQALAEYCVGALDRIRSRELQQASEEKFHNLFESSPDAIVVATRSGIIHAVNRQAEKLFGYTRAELVGQVIESLMPARFGPSHVAQRERFHHNPHLRPMGEGRDLWARHKDGTEFPADISLSPMMTTEGAMVISTIRDITKRKRAETELRHSRDRFELVAYGAVDGIWDWNVVTNEDYFSDRWCALLGYTARELQPRYETWVEHLHPEDQARALAAVKAHLEKCAPYDLEYRLRTKSGQYRWFHASGQAMWDEAGKPLRMAGSITDITARKEAQEALRESEARYRKLFEHAPVGIVTADPTGRYLDANAAMCRMIGHPRDELIGLHISDIVSEKELEHIEPGLGAVNSRLDHRREWEFRRKDGSLFEGEVIATTMADGNLLGMVSDITERKQAEAALVQLSGRLLRAQDDERRRLARELHDSTAQSLAALAMNLAVLGRDAASLDASNRALLGECEAQVKRATAELRTFAYLLHPPALEALGLARAVQDYAEGFAKRSGIRVEFTVEENFVRFAAETELALFRVLQESLGNLHRHSGTATATIRLACDAEGLTLEVRDTGRGLEEAQLQALRHGHASLGVGIAGMHERLRLLGGRLEIEPALPGLRVRATLPIAVGGGEDI
ncbi:MAG: PAS domain S-box protein [Verrucomicrobia bacterium]|nr:PAS domain S-box protein [Verrucomicrobiota bacterium]